MIKDNIKNLLIGIFIVVALLVCCMALDSADEINNLNESSMPKNIPKGTIILDNSSSVAVNSSLGIIKVKSSDLVHIKPKYPTISMWAKPSCGCRNSYRWHYRTFVNYCPHCKHYGVLRKNPKGVYEKEYTCVIDSCDYCAVCGKEKYSWSRYYLRRAY